MGGGNSVSGNFSSTGALGAAGGGAATIDSTSSSMVPMVRTSPGMKAGDVGEGTSVGTGMSVGDVGGRMEPGSALSTSEGSLVGILAGTFDAGTVGTGTVPTSSWSSSSMAAEGASNGTVGTCRYATSSSPPDGEVGAGCSVGTGISVGERACAGADSDRASELGAALTCGMGVSLLAILRSKAGDVGDGRSVGTGISEGEAGAGRPFDFLEIFTSCSSCPGDGMSVGTGISLGDVKATVLFGRDVFPDGTDAFLLAPANVSAKGSMVGCTVGNSVASVAVASVAVCAS